MSSRLPTFGGSEALQSKVELGDLASTRSMHKLEYGCFRSPFRLPDCLPHLSALWQRRAYSILAQSKPRGGGFWKLVTTTQDSVIPSFSFHSSTEWSLTKVRIPIFLIFVINIDMIWLVYCIGLVICKCRRSESTHPRQCSNV